jgi:hypothetical protein
MQKTITFSTLPVKPWKWLLLVILFCISIWYFASEFIYALMRDRDNDQLLRSTILLIHLIFTTPLLLLPPLQISRRIRHRWTRFHRRAGQIYLICACFAASSAIYLSATFEDVSRRVPLILFALLWLAFSLAAWKSALRRDFLAHEQFVARGYAIALAFVFVRLMGDTQDIFLGFLPEKAVRDVTREWLSFIIPLFIVESVYSWWPAQRARKTKM